MRVNIAGAEHKANPYPFYARLRAEAPAYRVTLLTKETAWLITRYDDVATVLKDARLIKKRSNALTPAQAANQHWFRKLLQTKWLKPLSESMLDQDPPDHTRLRALVNRAFTPGMVEQLRERIEKLADELLDAVRRRGRMDVIRDFALPVPTTVIAELLGVPAADRRQFHRWTKAMMSIATLPQLLKAVPNVLLFLRYLRRIIKQRRANPQGDLVSALIKAEEAGDRLSEKELLPMVLLLLVAGYETTANLIGNGTLALLDHPDQLAKLRHDPTLLKPAVEELLRYASPVALSTDRYAREDMTLAGATIRRGEIVFAVLASANRDEQQFAKPDTLDLAREPNKHLAFGLGTHFCLGAPLARLEGQIAIAALLRRLPDLRLGIGRHRLRWRGGLYLRGLEALPVAFGGGAGSASAVAPA